MSDEDVDRILAQPLVMIDHDGLPHDPVPQPTLRGTLARVPGPCTRQRRWLAPEVAAHQMTGLTARRFGLTARRFGLTAHGELRIAASSSLHAVRLPASKDVP